MNRYFSTVGCGILDSVFCVLKGLIQLKKKGFFACDFIKNRRHWSSMVPGKDMEDNFGEMEVGGSDYIQVTVDDVIYNLLGIKYPNYVISIMAIGGRLLADDKCKETVRRWK